MALTDIARQLKDTFEGFGVAEHQDVLRRFREIYGDAECIRLGEMDYIVINGVYRSQEYADVPESTSPLFYNSIHNTYAIIDAETSSTLIDEVYSRVTYMQRICENSGAPEQDELKRAFKGLIGENVEVSQAAVENEEAGAENKANIFQCQLVKDTGVSASPDVYSFMLKNGEVKEIADNLMRDLKNTGEVTLSKNRDQFEANRSSIQKAVFDKFSEDDMDIQSVTIKSIFEIVMTYMNIRLVLDELAITEGEDESKLSRRNLEKARRRGNYYASYFAGNDNKFDGLNANIHVCNTCNKELIDVKDSSNIRYLHVNTDALDERFTTDTERVYTVGCEDCLEMCPDCGGWHFNYSKHLGDTNFYARFKLAPGREFIRGLRSVEEGANYCRCRECIKWVYDERSGSETEHDIIPIEKIAFVNYANEKIAAYDEFLAYYDRKRNKKITNALDACDEAKRICTEFKKYLANKFDIDELDISITSSDKCDKCSICAGDYYRGMLFTDAYESFRCNVCTELISEKRRSVTRIDGIVFMKRVIKKSTVINKYMVTKFGNLKKLSTSIIDGNGTVTTEIEDNVDVDLVENADTAVTVGDVQ